MEEGTYCTYAGAICLHHNTTRCAAQSVLKHCNVLKEAANDANRCESAADNAAPERP